MTEKKKKRAREGSGTGTWGPRMVLKLMCPGSQQHTDLNLTVQRPQGVRKSFQVDPYVVTGTRTLWAGTQWNSEAILCSKTPQLMAEILLTEVSYIQALPHRPVLVNTPMLMFPNHKHSPLDQSPIRRAPGRHCCCRTRSQGNCTHLCSIPLEQNPGNSVKW